MHIPAETISYVYSELEKEIVQAINEGYCNFISGFVPGVDMIFAQIVVDLQTVYPHITLEAALPYPMWMGNRSQDDKALFAKCKKIGVHSPRYHANCFLIRNSFMMSTCERVIAVYDGRGEGGTVSTMRYAAMLARELRIIELQLTSE